MTYSSKLSSHYLELAEQPISKDVFAGEDVRFSSEYEALENELGKALSLHENGQTDWLKILENSEALLRAQSKDLRVAAWLTWALYQRESFPGLLAGLGLLERLCSRHWVEIHPLKARTRAAAIAWLVPRLEQALNENVPIKEQLPLFRRLAEHLEKLDTALTAQLGDDAPLLLPISRRLSGMLQRAADNQPEPGVVGAVVAQVKQAASQLLAPGAPIDNERDAHKAMRAQQEAARPLCAWWLKQKATDLRALRLNRTMLWLPIESMPERNTEGRHLSQAVPPRSRGGARIGLRALNSQGEKAMAKEGSVAPKERINVTFKPATGGAQEEIELPLKLLAIGDYTQRADERKVEDRKPIGIDKMTFDEVLAKQELGLTLSVPNRLQEEGGSDELAVGLQINSMKDFNPASIVEQVPELKKLMELRDALVALKGPLGNAPAFRKAIESVLADDESRSRVLGELGLSAAPSQDA